MFTKFMDRELEVSKTYKIKQDERNLLKSEIEDIIVQLLTEAGVEVSRVEKSLAFKLDNVATKLPNGYVPVKVAITIPSVDFDIDFEADYLEAEKVRKAEEKAEKERKAEAKKLRDAKEREMKRLAKEAKISKEA